MQSRTWLRCAALATIVAMFTLAACGDDAAQVDNKGDGATQDASTLDASRDATTTDVTVTDAATTDAATTDAATTDAGGSDAGGDAGAPDAGGDAGAPDAGGDAASQDSGERDAGGSDAALQDSGAQDSDGQVSCIPVLSGRGGSSGSFVTELAGSGNALKVTDARPAVNDITASGAVTFTGTVSAATCIWKLETSGTSIVASDFGGNSAGTITVTGATLSGSSTPLCVPSPLGCFPPCVAEIVGGPGQLTVTYTDGATHGLAFGCP